MAIKRLVPTRKPLGYLRLWRDDLSDTIALAGKIEGATVYLEADDCAISDPEADLPRLGKRLRYLTLKGLVTTNYRR